VCIATTQSDSGGKFSIWGGDCIGHGKRKSSYARVSDSAYPGTAVLIYKYKRIVGGNQDRQTDRSLTVDSNLM
jgi:hypothetical protein